MSHHGSWNLCRHCYWFLHDCFDAVGIRGGIVGVGSTLSGSVADFMFIFGHLVCGGNGLERMVRLRSHINHLVPIGVIFAIGLLINNL